MLPASRYLQQNVVVQVPNYPPLRHAPTHWGLNKVELEFVAQADGTYATPLDALSQSLANGGALLLCNPHNPTGDIWSREQLVEVATLARRHDVLVISDEIWAPLTMPGHAMTPYLSLGEELTGPDVKF